jgi:repressor LexA
MKKRKWRSSARQLQVIAERQLQIVKFIKSYLFTHPYPPTVREIRAGCKISSNAVTVYDLGWLERQGYIERYKGIARGIRLLRDEKEHQWAFDSEA